MNKKTNRKGMRILFIITIALGGVSIGNRVLSSLDKDSILDVTSSEVDSTISINKNSDSNQNLSKSSSQNVDTEPKQPLTENSDENTDMDSNQSLTVSSGGNINIDVDFKNLNKKDKEELVFEVSFNTHSEDLSVYEDLTQFVELRIDDSLIIQDGFTWETPLSGGHHVTGTLKINSMYKENSLIDKNTKKIILVFKNIGGIEEREHILFQEQNNLEYDFII